MLDQWVYKNREKCITVDYDVVDHSELDHLVFITRLKHVCTRYPCRITLTFKGVHVKICSGEYTWDKSLKIRVYLLDDLNRLAYDESKVLNGLSHLSEKLFFYKKDVSYRYYEREVSLEELERILLST